MPLLKIRKNAVVDSPGHIGLECFVGNEPVLFRIGHVPHLNVHYRTLAPVKTGLVAAHLGAHLPNTRCLRIICNDQLGRAPGSLLQKDCFRESA